MKFPLMLVESHRSSPLRWSSDDSETLTYDQPDNAARVARLGTSRTISRDRYSCRRVTKELSMLFSNPSYAAKATEIG
jgi:hypothetical protein